VADWDWLVVALDRVLGVKLPAPVRGAVKEILGARRSRGKLPVVVRSAWRFTVHAVDLASGDTTRRCIAAR
jgi:hypothetical protein